jgi:serine/threonine-protein kinase
VTLAPDVEHRLSLRADGYQPADLPVRVRPGEEWVRHVALVKSAEPRRIAKKVVAPPPPPAPAEHGYLSISTEPWTRMSIDGRQLGTTPLFKVKLPPGRHQIRFVNEVAKIDQVRTIQVSAGEITKETIDFR